MIPRYSRPDMVAIWSPETKFKIWYEIEAHACDAMAKLGVIPQENADAVWKAKDVEFDVARIDEIEAVTKHDVIAFLTSVEETIGSDSAYVHKGITSYDIVDTALSLLVRESLDVIIGKCENLKKVMQWLKD